MGTNPADAPSAASNRFKNAPVPTGTGLVINDFDQAMRLASTLQHSALMPDAVRGKPADILVLIMYGSELGLTAFQSFQAITIIKGRASMSSELRGAKTRQAGHRVGTVCKRIVGQYEGEPIRCGEYAEHSIHGVPTDKDPGLHPFDDDRTHEHCRIKVVRRDTGQITYAEFGTEDAIRAGLLYYGKGDLDGKLISRSAKGEPLPWESYGRDMCYNRALARACKWAAPEVGFGLYTEEEIERMPDPIRAEATVTVPIPDAGGVDPDAAAAEVAAMQTAHLAGE
jgi:hypothetical protein